MAKKRPAVNPFNFERYIGSADRADAIVCATAIEMALRNITKRKIRNEPKYCDNVLSGIVEPVGKYGTLCDSALKLGLINDLVHSDVILIGKIRNRFAHNIEIGSYSDEPVSSYCRDLNFIVERGFDSLTDQVFSPGNQIDPPHVQYRAGVPDLVSVLQDPRRRFRLSCYILMEWFFVRHGEDIVPLEWETNPPPEANYPI